MIFYTHLFIPERFAACTFCNLILIRPEYSDDMGLKAHELTHVDQFYRNWFHPLKYYFSKTYRLACEVEAYKVQLWHSPANDLKFAGFIAEKYDLDITILQALELLRCE